MHVYSKTWALQGEGYEPVMFGQGWGRWVPSVWVVARPLAVVVFAAAWIASTHTRTHVLRLACVCALQGHRQLGVGRSHLLLAREEVVCCIAVHGGAAALLNRLCLQFWAMVAITDH